MTPSLDRLGPALDLPNCCLHHIPGFLDKEEADGLFDRLRKKTPWRSDRIKVFGKVYDQPRLTALYGIEGKSYGYSGLRMNPLPFTQDIQSVLDRLQTEFGLRFTTCLLNLYRDGKDSNGWHADDEPELGQRPVIASVSLGQARSFHLRHKSDKELRHKMVLEHGSLLVMSGETQHAWQHQVPKTARTVGPRINLTFRNIY